MIGERENFNQETQYGSLIMRPYNIDGNEINAFYDSSDNLVFVLDNTIDSHKPNILLVINPDADKKWDEILSGDYGVDLETIRPKQDNKYQKFDIEYSGLPVYDTLIKAYNGGDSLEESLNQLTILRDSAARHSAMTRLNMANEIIAKTNATIVKTKESIVRLQARLKTLRAKLGEAKKGIGREPTKQSASKILKLESQIEATNEKLKRANERLKSAQRRLETATVDAELASELLNQPAGKIKQVAKKQAPVAIPAKRKAVVKKQPESEPEIEEEYEEEDVVDTDDKAYDEVIEEKEETEAMEEHKEEDIENVEPLFKEDPQILDDDIAFKPISFEAPAVPEISQSDKAPDLNKDMIVTEETTETTTEETEDNVEQEPAKEQQPVLESMVPVPVVDETPMPVVEPAMTDTETIEEEPIEEIPISEAIKEEEKTDEEPLKLEVVQEDMRQYEPGDEEKTTELVEENKIDEYVDVAPAAPVAPVAPIMPQNALNVGVVEEAEPKRSRFFYYFLLFLLIALAIFTLWFYQKNIKPTTPVLTASIEKTELPKEQKSIFNKKTNQKVKTSKQIKAPATRKDKELDTMPVFLDEEPVEIVPVETAPEPKTETSSLVTENVEIIEPKDTTPEVMDAVPARVTTSGQSGENENNISSEDDILARKPEYQPGSKYDEMFVADEDAEIINPVEYEYIEENTVYAPEEPQGENIVEDIDETGMNAQPDTFFDEEEAAYQAEQAELYYEE